MKKILLSCLMLIAIMSQSQVIIVQSGNDATQFSVLDDAINAAINGDFIYLSGGNFLKNDVPVNKEIHFVGAGIHPDSTAVTSTTSITVSATYFRIGSDADNSTFDGIIFNQKVMFADQNASTSDADNVIFSRCKLNGIDVREGAGVVLSNIVLQECIVNGSGNDLGKSGTSCLIDRCYVYNLPSGLENSPGLTALNSIVEDFSADNGTFTNCIFHSTSGGSNTFTNCFTADTDFGGSPVFTNSMTGVDWTTIFVNPTNANGYLNFNQDFHIIVGSAADNAGSDGTDLGIYGTSNPTKEGFVPYNPHFVSSVIPNSTDNSGNLNVEAGVAAQQN